LVSRIILVPHSLSTALFPRFAYVDREEASRLTSSSIQSVAVIITPAIIGLVGVAEPFFRIWIGERLAVQAVPIAYVLAGGFWIYCIGHMAYTMLHATGRPELVSKVLMAELPAYVLLLLIGLASFGVIGAAAAFTTRAVVDCLIFLRLGGIRMSTIRWLLFPAVLTLMGILTAAFVPGAVRYLLLAVTLAAASVWSIWNIPEPLKQFLGPLASRLPRHRGAEIPR
jgi:O-antigen/teichoic acid export membrane protein